MANITPVPIWYQGEQHNANVFSLYSTSDNLLDSATFQYKLIELMQINPEEEFSHTLITGELVIYGAEYELWDAQIDANAWIYNWAASKLNLVII